jgi:RecA-family ATPase
MRAAKDWNDAHVDGEDIHAAADREWSKVNKVHPPPTWRDMVFKASILKDKKFPEITYVIDKLIPDGLSMLVGRPKIGKSWLALDIALAVASTDGRCLGDRKVAHGSVLYCACEDSQRRLQSRITRLSSAYNGKWPDRLDLSTGWRRLDQGGVSDIAEWIKSVTEPRLVILDTLASVKPQRTNHGYHEDYAALEELHHLANNVGIAVLILHHQRKSEAEDPLDTISGTLGLAGCVDTPIILSGTSKGMTLYVRGRDIEEAEHAVAFDKGTCRWRILGEAAEVQRSDTRTKILSVLKKVKPRVMGPSDIAAATDIKEPNVKMALGRMLADGEVIKSARGDYAHA